ncbi:MAG: hypothetical protein KF833_05275 [Verrucomicrobiae bacterium]|nr:hypothetical protein [Verrucomicrobiae bacterium]
MKHESRLNPSHEEDLAASAQTHSDDRIFPTAEDALRADRSVTPPPPELARRLAASLTAEPPPKPASWWRRLLGHAP